MARANVPREARGRSGGLGRGPGGWCSCSLFAFRFAAFVWVADDLAMNEPFAGDSPRPLSSDATPRGQTVWWYRNPEGPDAGSPLARTIALVALVVFVCTVVVMNQFGGGEPASEAAAGGAGSGSGQVEPEPAASRPSVLAPTDADPFVIAMKMLVRVAHFMGAGESEPGAMLAMNIDQNAVSDRQKLWAAIAATEIAGVPAGVLRLDGLAGELEAHPERLAAIDEDLAVARLLVQGQREDLSTERLDAFVDRNGWFGKLGRALGLPASDPSKASLVRGGGLIVLAIVMFGVVLVVMCIGSLIASIMMLVRYSQGQLRRAFVAPAVGGSVWLETAAVFVLAFLMLKLGVTALAIVMTPAGGTPPHWVQTAPLVLQWLVLLSIFWPLVRGMAWTEYRRQIGLHSGLGFWREVGAGIWGYLAGLPLLAIAMGITVLIVVIKGALSTVPEGAAPEQPGNPIVDLLSVAGPFEMVMFFLLATVWAPLTEEIVFRGALFRHIRSRVALWLAAPITALVFGMMHGYDALLLLPVITIGFIFAFVREWRASLVGPITAHALHNGTLLVFAIALFSALK